MSDDVPRRKTFEVPDDGPKQPPDQPPIFFFGELDRDGRDTSKPIAYDEHGNPIYAPRGIRLQ